MHELVSLLCFFEGDSLGVELAGRLDPGVGTEEIDMGV